MEKKPINIITTLISCMLISFLLPIGCSSPGNQTSAGDGIKYQIEFDSVQKILIDTMVNQINAGLNQEGNPHKLAYPLQGPNDTIYYWIVNGNSARISIEMKPPQEVYWPTFFVHEGKLVFVRYRTLTKSSPTGSHAAEAMIYLNNGKIVYCEERQMDLKEGEIAGLLRQKEYSKSTRSYIEIEQDYIDYWNTIRAYMKKENALPAFLDQ